MITPTMLRSSSLPALFAALIALAAPLSAAAQARTGTCMVSDPTGTQLNVRGAPNGRPILFTLPNGYRVVVDQIAYDRQGRPWAYVHAADSGENLGWVFREFISCW